VFRKLHRGKKIELSCPHCGNLQFEPSRVISSFCKSCGEHFRVRKGIAIPNAALRVSGISEVIPSEKSKAAKEKPKRKQSSKKKAEETEKAGKSDSWLMSAKETEDDPRHLPRQEEAPEKTASGISAGAFFGLVEEEEVADAASSAELGRKAQAKEALAEGSMAALIEHQAPAPAQEKGKMPPNFVPPDKRRGLVERSHDFSVRCYRCYHVQPVSKFAKSTQCERCSVYIGLADYEIKANKQHTLRTRGDIVVAKKGGLRNCAIACHNLTVNGVIDAYVDCSGDAVFRKTGKVRGHLYCRKLIVEKNAVVEFPDGVKTEWADIVGRVIGDVTCSGTVQISKSGTIEGDVTTIDLQMKDGAVISGEKTLDPEVSTELSVKIGFNPSVIG
jgi:cytoskeletal protein CcmA (bactofilin family)/ribosomal protein S27E